MNLCLNVKYNVCVSVRLHTNKYVLKRMFYGMFYIETLEYTWVAYQSLFCYLKLQLDYTNISNNI
jgi:hypothetical protein